LPNSPYLEGSVCYSRDIENVLRDLASQEVVKIEAGTVVVKNIRFLEKTAPQHAASPAIPETPGDLPEVLCTPETLILDDLESSPEDRDCKPRANNRHFGSEIIRYANQHKPVD
jgi:hypothetical protein